MINRRRFLMEAGLGVAISRAAYSAGAGFDLGIGTFTYRGVTVGEMVRDLKALDIRHVEISSPNYMLVNVKPGAVEALRAGCDARGIKPLSYFCGGINTDADLDRAVEIARILGADHVSGGAANVMLKKIDARFNRESLRFGIHNHWFRGRKGPYSSPDDILKALKGLTGAVGATLDLGHMAACGYDPVWALETLWPHLQMVHLKDVAQVDDGKNVVLGEGIARSCDAIELLMRRRFSNLVAIEYEAAPEDPQPDVTRCVEFVRSRVRSFLEVQSHPLHRSG